MKHGGWKIETHCSTHCVHTIYVRCCVSLECFCLHFLVTKSRLQGNLQFVYVLATRGMRSHPSTISLLPATRSMLLLFTGNQSKSLLLFK